MGPFLGRCWRTGLWFRFRLTLSIVCLATTCVILYTGTLLHHNTKSAWASIWHPSPLLTLPIANVDWETSPYLVDTPACRLPSLPPFSPSIQEFVRFHRPQNCSDVPRITFTEGPYIRVNPQEVSQWRHGLTTACFATDIVRGENDSALVPRPFSVLSTRQPFLMTTDFARVHCLDPDNRTVYEEFHFNIQNVAPLPLNTAGPRPISILILGVDSTSRLNMLRQMRRTYAFLKSLPGHVLMLGYNKLGENTFPNVVPLLSGRLLKEQPCFNKKEFFDECPLIWKDFRERGYATLYAEDRPRIATFNFEKPGFRRPPTHYYLRPLTLGVESSLIAKARLATVECIGRRTETQMVLDYTLDFVEKHSAAGRPFFAYSFVTGRSHGDINNIGTVDHEYEAFFRTLNSRGLLDNTLVIFFSDHGIRYGAFRKTNYGRHEARLPLMSIILPKSLMEENPEALRHLHTNARRLTVPTDIHATLRELGSIPMISYDNRVKPRKSYSLLSMDVPIDRTCEDAGIAPLWCACRITERVLPQGSFEGNLSGRVLVQHINKVLARKHPRLCAPLQLQQVLSAIVMSNDDGHDKDAQVLVTASVVPSGAIFEAVVSLQRDPHGRVKKARLLDGISRINLYGRQSHCIRSANLKNFCYCYDQ